MTSLTLAAYQTRRIINWLILGFIGYLIARFLFGVLLNVYGAVFPPKPPPPNHAFGKLPKIEFPQLSSDQPTKPLSYKLETIEGSVPAASESARVYFMPKKAANLLALTQTQEFAKRLQFDPTPLQQSRNVYQFQDPDTALRKLRYDIITDNFLVSYDWKQDTGLFTERSLPLPDAGSAQARSLLQTYDLYTDDIAGGSIQITFLKFTGERLTPTTSYSQADSIRVDFIRKSINAMPVVSSSPSDLPISITFSSSTQSKKRILQFAYTYWPVDYETYATYALKPSSQAWQELQNGAGFIARYPSNGDTAVIRNITLGYFDSLEPQTYLQPIFIFEGDNDFLAYISAVAPPWTE